MNRGPLFERSGAEIREMIDMNPTASMLERIGKSGIDPARHEAYVNWLEEMESAEGEVTSVKVFHDLISHCIAIGRSDMDRDMLADIAFEYADDAAIAYEEIRDARHDLFTNRTE